MWVDILRDVREAVLSFQHTVATRNDLGMLASLHNKFVRSATFRLGASLLEILDELPPQAETDRPAALAADAGYAAALILPTGPTRLALGERVTLTAVAPGIYKVSEVLVRWRRLGSTAWTPESMRLVRRRTYAVEL